MNFHSERPCSDVNATTARDCERHDHAERAQQRGRVREVVVADEPGQHDDDREGELRRIDERRLLFYFCFHALCRRRPLRAQLHPAKLARQEGLEPPTCGFGDRCSTN